MALIAPLLDIVFMCYPCITSNKQRRMNDRNSTSPNALEMKREERKRHIEGSQRSNIYFFTAGRPITLNGTSTRKRGVQTKHTMSIPSIIGGIVNDLIVMID